MGPATRKLLSISGQGFSDQSPVSGLAYPGVSSGIAAEINEILSQKNGFFAFESALRFYSGVTTDSSWGISEWNQPALWKDDYRGLANGIFCFAEDLFGGQFCVSDRGVCIFGPETGDLEVVGTTIEEWAAAILKDYNVLTGYPLAHDWQADNRPLKGRERLIPRIPFVTGGAFQVANMVALDSVRVMKNLGNLARQIHELPDGAKIQFEIR